MPYSRADLVRRFDALDDRALLERLHHEGLTPEAVEVLHAEIARRGLQIPAAGETAVSAPEDLGNLEVLTRAFDPTEAFLLRGLLESEGIPAFVADCNLVQANQFLTPALGFVRVMVPESKLEEARSLVERFRRGEFSLADDMEIDDAEPEAS